METAQRIEPVPPSSLEAEEAVLGALLIDQEAMYRVSLEPGDFASEKRGWIFSAMKSLDVIDFLTVCDLLEKRGQLDEVGGPAYITGLINATPTSVHAEHYGNIVAGYAAMRRAITAAGAIAQKAHTCTDPDELAEYCEQEILKVRKQRSGGPVHVGVIANRFYNLVEEWSKNPLPVGGVRGLSTGLKPLDELTGGLKPGELVIFCGRPAMGKSSLVFEIARRVAETGKNVLCFSLEMTAQAIVGRWASALSGVEKRLIETSRADEDQYSRYVMTMLRLEGLGHIWIDEQPGLSASDIRSRAMRHYMEHGVDLIIIDHCGRMKTEGNRNENTATTEGRKSSRMKDLAKELGIPVILAVQMSRANESRSDKKPTLPDLRGTGEHEENADDVLGIYREEYYDPETDKRNIMEVLSLKQREGPAGVSVLLPYEASLSRFDGHVIRTSLNYEEL